MTVRSSLPLPFLLSTLLLAPAAGFAQQPGRGSSTGGSPVADALRQDLQRSSRILVAAAEAMPADKYGYKPTEAQMSFGQLVLHVAGSNDFMCSGISGTKAPTTEKLAPTAPKDQLVARLRSSFEYCRTALANANDSDLSTQLPFFGGRTMSRAGIMMGLAADWADHYGAAAMYLRMNGILPPTARRPGTAGM